MYVSNLSHFGEEELSQLMPEDSTYQYIPLPPRPVNGMNDIDPETLRVMIIANRIAVPIWIIAGFYGDAMGKKTGSAVSALAGGFITANLATMAVGQSDVPTGGRILTGAFAALAAFFTVSDVISVFKKKPDSPTFKTKFTRLSKAVAGPA